MKSEKMPYPKVFLMSAPTFFKVVDVKNPFMEGNVGKTESSLALKQWQNLKRTFELAGVAVEEITPTEGCEDMVFCANQSLPGVLPNGEKAVVMSHMKHESRQREVPAFQKYYEENGYKIFSIPEKNILFEGMGDAIWHPERQLLWGGVGARTQEAAYGFIEKFLQTPVIKLRPRLKEFYHLDTCFCPLNEDAVLLYPAAFSNEDMARIRAEFNTVVEVDHSEAILNMACNAASILGKNVVLQSGSSRLVKELKQLNFSVFEVDTSEFMKSGGSVFCMKVAVF